MKAGFLALLRLPLGRGLFAIPLYVLLSLVGPGAEEHRPDDDGDEPPKVEVPPGFKAELLYSPSAHEQGSWVSMAVDPRGRLIASDQYGKLYRITLRPVGPDSTAADVEPLEIEIGHAQGLLWAFNSLYAVVNRFEEEEGFLSGLYRIRDLDGDDRFDTVDTLRTLEGSGEHGPHSILLGPDSLLYVIAGNHTDLPAPFTSRVPPVWQEDNLLPPLPDPRGHAVDRTAPGGWVAKTDSLGAEWELFSVGFRNAFDLAFNEDGELFTFDSDMEWDLGMPWYRPIRVLHVTSGSDFGWRTGSGKWPAYYPDTLPSVVDVGQGSPTGVLSAANAAFPARYRGGLFVFDWSYGTIYWVDLRPRGSSYTGTVEEFLTGTPLPLTDGVIGPDGALYFLTGGRKLDSYLYRVTYTGEDSAQVEQISAGAYESRRLRRRLEWFHTRPDAAALVLAWPHLDHPDRFVRYAARVAVEQLPVALWQERVLSEEDPEKRLYGVLALARHAGPEVLDEALQALHGIAYDRLGESQQIDLLRTYQVLLTRMGPASDAARRRLIAQLDGFFPAGSAALNRELVRLLVYLEAPGIIEEVLALLEAEEDPASDIPFISEEVMERSEQYGPTVAKMLENMPKRQAISYVLSLSHAAEGWTLPQRRAYFRWLYDALKKSGGESYKGFIEQIRVNALEHVPMEEQEALAAFIGTPVEESSVLADLPQPEGPGRAWNKHEILEVLDDALDVPRNFERGERMFAAALCAACHRMRGEGGNIGPDLTQVGTRFGAWDLVDAIVNPSAVVSDQYAATLLTLKDGSVVSGRIVGETDEVVRVNQDPYHPSQVTTIPVADIQEREPSPLSIMPPGLFNRLNEEEVADLIAYLLAGGDPAHEHFTPQSASAPEEDTEGE